MVTCYLSRGGKLQISRRRSYGRFITFSVRHVSSPGSVFWNLERAGEQLPSRFAGINVLGTARPTHSFLMDQAARTYRCEVDTLTLSIEQKTLAEDRIREAGLQDLVRVHLMDYREIPPTFEKKFDAFISVEMLEVNFSLLLFESG
jgi:hypothetical protein